MPNYYDSGQDDSGEQDFVPEFTPPQGGNSDGEDIYQALPTRVVGGLDQYRARQQRQIDAMLKQSYNSPVYEDGMGGVTKEAPDEYLSGEYIPMRGPVQRIVNPQAIPIQYKQAQEMQKQFRFPSFKNGLPLTDQDVQVGAQNIWNQMLQMNGGNMSPENLANSPFWNQFTGMDNDALTAVKASVYNSIKPYYKEHVNKQKTMKLVQEEMTDPETGQFFSQFFKPYEKDIMSKAGSEYAKSLVNNLRQKAEILGTDPFAKEAFDELAQSVGRQIGPDDNLTQAQIDDLLRKKNYFNKLMLTKSGSSFGSILGSYTQYKQGLKDKRDKLNQTVMNEFENASGGEQLAGFVSKAVESGYYDGREWELKSDLNKIKKSDGQVKIGNLPTINGGKMFFDEKTALDKIEELRQNGYQDANIFITPDRKVLAGDKYEEYEKHSLNLRFPDSGRTGRGKYIALRDDIFKNENGDTVFLTVPGVSDKSPISFTANGKQYVLRDALQKVGITPEDIKAGELGEDLVLGKNKESFLSGAATPYETRFVTANKFTDKSIPDGARFMFDKEFYEQSQLLDKNRELLASNELIMAQDPTDPNFVGELTKGVVRGFGKTLISTGVRIGEGYRGMYDLLRTGIYRMIGDEEGAKNAWKDAVQTSQNIGEIDQSIDEAASAGFLGLDKVMADPTAGMEAHVAGTVGEIVGTIGGIATEMAASKGLGAPVLTQKLTTLAGRLVGYNQQMAKLSALAGKGAELANIRTKLGRINIVTSESLGFVAQAIAMGQISPMDVSEGYTSGALKMAGQVGEGALLGSALGVGRAFGRGFNTGKVTGIKEVETLGGVAYRDVPGLMSQPKMIDRTRFIAASLAGAGTIGLDSVIKQFHGMTTPEIVEWWKNPDNIAAMGFQLMLPYFGAMKLEGRNLQRQMQGPAHAEMLPRPALLNKAAGRMTPNGVQNVLRGTEADYTHGYTDLHDHYEMATMSELSDRGRVLSGHIERFAESGQPVPEALIKEFESVRQRLLGDKYHQGIILKDAKAKDLEEWGIIKKMLPQLENKEPIKEVKLIGLQKSSTAPVVSEVTKMQPSELVSYINTVRENPTMQYSEAGKFNAAIKRLVDIAESEPPADKKLNKAVQAIVTDQNLLARAARPLPEQRPMIGDEIINPTTNGKINSKTVENAIKIKQTADKYDKHLSVTKEEKADFRKTQGWEPRAKNRGGFLKKTDKGWVAHGQIHGRKTVGVEEHVIPESKSLTETEADFLAREYFDQKYALSKEKMKDIVAHEVYGEKMETPFEEIAEADREIANTLFEDAFEKKQNIQDVVKKLTSDKYGFTKDEVDSLLSDYVREQSKDLGEMRDFLKDESKELGCD